MTTPTEFTVTFKNVPLDVMAMFESAFHRAPLLYIGEPLKIPDTGLTIDFQDITDLKMEQDMVKAANAFVMAHAFLAVKQQQRREGK